MLLICGRIIMRALDRRTFVKLAGIGLGLTGISHVLTACDELKVKIKGPGSVGPPVSTLPTHDHWWLSGNYAPVTESESQALQVIGKMPNARQGTYIRNGPNPVSGESTHWFAGDGMLHAERLTQGQASWYRARSIQTHYLQNPPS